MREFTAGYKEAFIISSHSLIENQCAKTLISFTVVP